jgi:hypothetical protein
VEEVPVKPTPEPIAPAPAFARLAGEVDALGPLRVVARSDAFTVLHARGSECPNLLHEVGRQREIALRQAGEGTGHALDLDAFDGHYDHLVLWHAPSGVAGACRLAWLPAVLATHGMEGLHTYSLFAYGKELLGALGPAVELGRAFVRADLQRTPLAHALLWRGIGQYLAARPACRQLFGPCGLDRRYPDPAILLVLGHLAAHRYARDLVSHVRPRVPWAPDCPDPGAWVAEGARLRDPDAVGRRVAELDPGGRGLPALLQRYLRLGADIASFNVDRAFGDVVDVLIRLDLDREEAARLDRFRGGVGVSRAAS